MLIASSSSHIAHWTIVSTNASILGSCESASSIGIFYFAGWIVTLFRVFVFFVSSDKSNVYNGFCIVMIDRNKCEHINFCSATKRACHLSCWSRGFDVDINCCCCFFRRKQIKNKMKTKYMNNALITFSYIKYDLYIRHHRRNFFHRYKWLCVNYVEYEWIEAIFTVVALYRQLIRRLVSFWLTWHKKKRRTTTTTTTPARTRRWNWRRIVKLK